MVSEITYTSFDIVVLHAIGMASRKRPARLEAVVAAADAIDHDILSYRQVAVALSKSVAAGHVVHENGLFSLSDEFRPTYSGIMKRARTWVGAPAELMEYFHARPYPAADKIDDWPYPALTPAEYDEAVRKYISAPWWKGWY